MDTDALREVLLKLVQCTETDNRQMHTKNVSLIIKQKRPKITGDLIFQTVISFKAIYYSKKKTTKPNKPIESEKSKLLMLGVT